MSSERMPNGFMRVVLAGFGLTLLGGCTHADAGALEMFVMDLLRSVSAALVL